MASVKLLLKTNKTLKNGKHPIAIRIIKDRKTRFVFTGKSALEAEWDFATNLPNRKHPLYKELTIYLRQKVTDTENEVLNLEKGKQPFSATQVKSIIKSTQKNSTIFEFYDTCIAELAKAGRISTAGTYKNAKNSFLRFMGGKTELYFSSVDLSFLTKYENFMLSTGVSTATIHVYVANLHRVFNIAYKEKAIHINKQDLPFEDFDLSRLKTVPPHRAMEKEAIEKIFTYPLEEGTPEFHAQCIFKFSYYAWGMNFSDMAKLCWKDIQNGRVMYRRSKTGRLYNIPVLGPMQSVLEYYTAHAHKTGAEDYVFPILNKTVHTSPEKIKDRIKSVLKATNKALQRLAFQLGIEGKVTSYMARHTFATNLRNMDVPTAKIQYMLGHSTEKQTQTYLDSFKNNELDEAALLLLK